MENQKKMVNTCLSLMAIAGIAFLFNQSPPEDQELSSDNSPYDKAIRGLGEVNSMLEKVKGQLNMLVFNKAIELGQASIDGDILMIWLDKGGEEGRIQPNRLVHIYDFAAKGFCDETRKCVLFNDMNPDYVDVIEEQACSVAAKGGKSDFIAKYCGPKV